MIPQVACCHPDAASSGLSGFQDVPGVGDRSVRYIFTTGGTDITNVYTAVDRWILNFSSQGAKGQDNALCNTAELVDLAKIAEKNLRAIPVLPE